MVQPHFSRAPPAHQENMPRKSVGRLAGNGMRECKDRRGRKSLRTGSMPRTSEQGWLLVIDAIQGGARLRLQVVNKSQYKVIRSFAYWLWRALWRMRAWVDRVHVP